MKPGLYYYEPEDMLYDLHVYDIKCGYFEIYYYDFISGKNITFVDPDLSQEFIENSVYLGEV